MFDNVLVCDDPEYAKKVAEETWAKHKDVCVLFHPSITFFHIINILYGYLIETYGWFIQAEKASFDEAEKKREEEVLFCFNNLLHTFMLLFWDWVLRMRLAIKTHILQ